MANNGIYYSSGNTLNFTTNNTTWATITSGGTFVMNTVSGGTYLNLPSATFTGGTVSGATNFTGGLTANTISATTYLNLPVSAVTNGTGISASTSNGTVTIINTAPDQTVTISGGTGITTGGTYPNFTILNSAPDQTVTITGGTNMQIVGTYPNFGVNFTGSTTGGTSGDYLPLSGGTITGGLVANSGVTANTISQTSYIDFTTGSTNPSSVAGRLFFDSTQKALSYFDIVNTQVPIAMGQQLYTRVWNATGVQIDKGKVIAITGTSNNLPSAILARNVHEITSARPIGLAAENIPNGSEGLVLNNGILSGITLNTFANGDTLYLSDTVPGGYISSTSSLSFTARTNEIGYVLQTGSTTGKIYVNINNEDSNLSLTDKERNILEGNVISGGVYEYTGMTQGTGQTINVAMTRGWIVRNAYSFATLPDVTNVYYTGGTNIPLTYLNSADATYILLTSASTLYQQTTFPTPQQRRENIFLGKVVHPNRSTITSINQTVDFDVSPMAALRDLWTPLKLINQGIIVSYYSAGTMSIQTSAGTLWGNGIGWTTNQQNPDSISISGTSPTTFQYRSRLGPITGSTSNPGDPAAPTGNTTTIDSRHYDLNGSIVPVGGNNRATNQRIYLFPTGLIRIQYGQFSYSNIANAIAGIDTEIFVEYGNNRDNGILIGILTVRENASDLSLTTDAQFRFVSKFGELLAGAGGISTTTLQQAYDNSTTPEIVINSTLDGLSIKNGTGNADNVTNLLEGQNSGGTTTSFIRADGAFSGTSIYGTGLSATTISATTYLNLPQSVSGTGTTNYIPKWTGSTGLGNSQLQDDGSQVYTNQGYGSPLTGNLSINASGTTGIAGRATQYGIYGTISGTTSAAAGVYGDATKGQYGVYGNNTGDVAGTYIGVFGNAAQADTGVAGTTYIGGKFKGDPVTSSAYSLWLEDGTEGVGKVLVSQTSDGKANWNTFSGINITITSAATNTLVFSAGTNVGGGVTSLTTRTGLSGNSTTGDVSLQLSASSYSMFVNNTASAAAPTQVTYKDTGDASFSSNITWGTTTPSPNTGNYRYRWTQVGNTVNFYFVWTLVAGGGAGQTPITITLPNDMPQPAIPTGFNAASYVLHRYPFNANNSTGGGGATTTFGSCALVRNAGNTAYDIVYGGSVIIRWFSITGQYFV